MRTPDHGKKQFSMMEDAPATERKHSFYHDFVLDLDIKSFFDTIDHELMMKAVKHYCQDKWVLLYVERWLKSGIVQRDGKVQETEMGTPQGGVISPLLANIFLHVVFDKWMEKEHAEKAFERYADDVVVHCKTEKQAIFLLRKIEQRMKACKLSLHPLKTKIVNLRGTSEKKYASKFDFLGFSIRPQMVQFKDKLKVVPSICISIKSRQSVLEKFKELAIHKRRIPLEKIAKQLNPVIRGVINYYHHYSHGHMRYVWNQLNARLHKWEKGLYKYAAIRWLKQKYKSNPTLFAHWKLVHP